MGKRFIGGLFTAGLMMLPLSLLHAQESNKLETLPAAADHHMHIQGPGITAELRREAARNPKVFEGLDKKILEQRTGKDALKVLDAAGIHTGVLLSEAYMFASPMAKPDHLEVARLTRAENQYNVTAAAESGGRLVAFIGVDPLAANAIPEMEYWVKAGGARGVKLHLANSGFDFHSPVEVRKLAEFFGAARAAKMPIVIHVRNSANYGAKEARIFVQDVLPAAGDLPVQVAHGTGWGGLDDATLSALAVFAEAIAEHRPGTKNVVFDLALVVTNDKTDHAQAQRLADLMRQIGIRRFVLGSDWPALYTPGQYYKLLVTQVPLRAEEWKQIFQNRAPYLN